MCVCELCKCGCTFSSIHPSIPPPSGNITGWGPSLSPLSPLLCQTQRRETGTTADSASLQTCTHTHTHTDRLLLSPNLAPLQFHLGLSPITSTPPLPYLHLSPPPLLPLLSFHFCLLSFLRANFHYFCHKKAALCQINSSNEPSQG